MSVSVKIYGKKRGAIAKKGPNTKNNFMKSNSPSGFNIYEYGNFIFYLLGSVILPIWISNKSEKFLKSMPTSSVAINVRFLGVIDPKSNLNGKFFQI